MYQKRERRWHRRRDIGDRCHVWLWLNIYYKKSVEKVQEFTCEKSFKLTPFPLQFTFEKCAVGYLIVSGRIENRIKMTFLCNYPYHHHQQQQHHEVWLLLLLLLLWTENNHNCNKHSIKLCYLPYFTIMEHHELWNLCNEENIVPSINNRKKKSKIIIKKKDQKDLRLAQS